MRAIVLTVVALGAWAGLALGGGGELSDLESPDPAVRRAAARTLAEEPDEAVLGELIRALRREEDGEIRRLMEIAAGRIGDRRALWDLFRWLEGKSDDAALWAIRTIVDGEPPCSPDDRAALAGLSRERALEWWEERKNRSEYRAGTVLRPGPEEEAALLDDLRSGEENAALRAAERLDPWRLTLEELRIQASWLSRHPHSWALQAIGRPIGTVDFPTLWKNLARSDLTFGDCQGRTHWAVLPDAIPVLADLLPEANKEWFREFSGLLSWVARDTDRFRLDAARGFAYALLRIERERAGRERPAMGEIPAVRSPQGIPPAFVALARNRVEMERAPARDRADPAAFLPPLPWLRRWARDLDPVESDLSFLVRFAREAKDLADRAWAVRAMGRTPGPGAARALEELAALDTDTALFAAAERAKAGEPVRFRELLEANPDERGAEMLAFDVFPEEAIRRWVEKAARSESEDAWEDPLFDPSAEADLERLFFFGIGVGDEVRERLAAALPLDRVPVETLAWFLTEVSAAPLDGPGREAVFRRLREFEVPEDESFDWDPAPLTPLLGLLEVRDPDRVVELLRHWADHREGELRTLALRLLGRLGDTTHVPEIIEVWAAEEFFDFGTGWLGQVKDERVKRFLEERAGGEGAAASAAAEALGVWYGLPEAVAGWFFTYDADLAASEAFREARETLRAGDSVGAALLLLTANPDAEPVELGAVADPRAVEALRRLRADRGHYWEATAGLALAGDPEARRELAGLLRDGRTWNFYPLQDGRAFTFGTDPAWIDFQVERVDATCCIGFSALETLGELFPTLCTREGSCRVEVANLIGRWWRKNRDRLAWSRILGGRVPR